MGQLFCSIFGLHVASTILAFLVHLIGTEICTCHFVADFRKGCHHGPLWTSSEDTLPATTHRSPWNVRSQRDNVCSSHLTSTESSHEACNCASHQCHLTSSDSSRQPSLTQSRNSDLVQRKSTCSTSCLVRSSGVGNVRNQHWWCSSTTRTKDLFLTSITFTCRISWQRLVLMRLPMVAGIVESLRTPEIS